MDATKGVFIRRRNELCSKEVRPGEQAPINMLLALWPQAAQVQADVERKVRSAPDPPPEEGARMVKSHRYAEVPGREGYVSCKSRKSTKQIAQLNMAGKCAYTPEYAEDNSYMWAAHVKGHKLLRNQGLSYSATFTRCRRDYLGLPRKDCEAALPE